VLLLPCQRKSFLRPLNCRFFSCVFLLFSIPTNPEFRNPQTTPSKNRWKFFQGFHPTIQGFNVQRPLRMEMVRTHITSSSDFRALWPSRLNLKFDNPKEIIKAFLYATKPVCNPRRVVNLNKYQNPCLVHVWGKMLHFTRVGVLCSDYLNVRFQVLTAASMMFRIVFWAVHPRRQFWIYLNVYLTEQIFTYGTFCEHLKHVQRISVWNLN
jgi:hypothetical protein